MGSFENLRTALDFAPLRPVLSLPKHHAKVGREKENFLF